MSRHLGEPCRLYCLFTKYNTRVKGGTSALKEGRWVHARLTLDKQLHPAPFWRSQRRANVEKVWSNRIMIPAPVLLEPGLVFSIADVTIVIQKVYGAPVRGIWLGHFQKHRLTLLIFGSRVVSPRQTDTRHTASLQVARLPCVERQWDSSALSEQSLAVSVCRYKQECLTLATVTFESHRQRSASTRLLEDFHDSYCIPAEGLWNVANLMARLERTWT
jgi:hypothetical protein